MRGTNSLNHEGQRGGGREITIITGDENLES